MSCHHSCIHFFFFFNFKIRQIINLVLKLPCNPPISHCHSFPQGIPSTHWRFHKPCKQIAKHATQHAHLEFLILPYSFTLSKITLNLGKYSHIWVLIESILLLKLILNCNNLNNFCIKSKILYLKHLNINYLTSKLIL